MWLIAMWWMCSLEFCAWLQEAKGAPVQLFTVAKIDKCNYMLHSIKIRFIQYSIKTKDARSVETYNTLTWVVKALLVCKLQACSIGKLCLQQSLVIIVPWQLVLVLYPPTQHHKT